MFENYYFNDISKVAPDTVHSYTPVFHRNFLCQMSQLQCGAFPFLKVEMSLSRYIYYCGKVS